ncbi:MAG: uracil-DNA glycosylase [Chloroflexota bacterium]|nr:MAG: uracil-DNA glycosylase [Chloroflexota bacterium]
MDGRRRVLSRLNGPIDAAAIFVAEAPGRLGADRTGVPLSGDQTARNFDWLLSRAGLTRDDVFITNAVLCNPRDAAGNNRPPTRSEIARCREHLAATLAIVRAPLVVALGSAALTALDAIEGHDLRLARDVGRPVAWQERRLVALYHPGPRARVHRPVSDQEADFEALGTTIRESGW